jgi:hypothetical protein
MRLWMAYPALIERIWPPPVVEKMTDAVWWPTSVGGIRSGSDTVKAEAIQHVLAASKAIARASMALPSVSRASVSLPSTVLTESKAVP